MLTPALSCAERQRESKCTEAEREQADARDAACNEATLLVCLLAYNLANRVRLLMENAALQPLPATSGHQRLPERKPLAAYLVPRCGWSLQRFREQVLKTAARFLLGGREVVVVIAGAAAELWQRLWCRLDRLQPLTT